MQDELLCQSATKKSQRIVTGPISWFVIASVYNADFHENMEYSHTQNRNVLGFPVTSLMFRILAGFLSGNFSNRTRNNMKRNINFCIKIKNFN